MIIDIVIIIGFTLIITTSKMIKPVREFFSKKVPKIGELLGCALCTGFWVGLAVYFCPDNIRDLLLYVSGGSLSSELIYLIFKRLQIR